MRRWGDFVSSHGSRGIVRREPRPLEAEPSDRYGPFFAFLVGSVWGMVMVGSGLTWAFVMGWVQ